MKTALCLSRMCMCVCVKKKIEIIVAIVAITITVCVCVYMYESIIVHALFLSTFLIWICVSFLTFAFISRSGLILFHSFPLRLFIFLFLFFFIQHICYWSFYACIYHFHIPFHSKPLLN